jgi:hypothetical protein
LPEQHRNSVLELRTVQPDGSLLCSGGLALGFGLIDVSRCSDAALIAIARKVVGPVERADRVIEQVQRRVRAAK